MSTPMDDAEEYAEDEDLARLVRSRIVSSLPSRPLAELAVEFGIDMEELEARGDTDQTSVLDVLRKTRES